MSKLIAALPMYDWPEVRGEIDAQWAQLRDAFRRRGIDAPERMARSNRDLPPVSGGIQDGAGKLIAPDPATLPPDEFDFHQLWLSPALLFGQTCWGPMELGLARHVQVVAQPSYDAFEGGQGELYSSALVMPADGGRSVGSPEDGKAVIPLDLIRGKRFIFNNPDSMSGLLGLTRDLEAIGESLGVFASCGESGGHRSSIVAIAEGRADIAAIDCQSWALAQRFEPAARRVKVVGWTTRRKGLPFISARATSADVVASMREAIAEFGLDGSAAKQLFVERVG